MGKGNHFGARLFELASGNQNVASSRLGVLGFRRHRCGRPGASATARVVCTNGRFNPLNLHRQVEIFEANALTDATTTWPANAVTYVTPGRDHVFAIRIVSVNCVKSSRADPTEPERVRGVQSRLWSHGRGSDTGV